MSRAWLEGQQVCPYYVRHGAGRIVCRSRGEAQRLALEFDRPARLLAYYGAHCRAGGANCPQRRTLEAFRCGT